MIRDRTSAGRTVGAPFPTHIRDASGSSGFKLMFQERSSTTLRHVRRGQLTWLLFPIV